LGKIFERAVEMIKRNKERRENGLVNCIPFTFKRLEYFLPGVQKSTYTIITASSGIGKSKFTKKIYVIDVVDFVLANPKMGIKVNIMYFCLEEGKEKFICSIIVYRLYELHKIRRDVKYVMSIRAGKVIEDDVIEKIDAMEPWFDKFEEIVDVIDDIKNSFGIFVKMRDFALKHGHWVYKKETFKDGDGIEKKIRDYFVPAHPDHYMIGIIDHISLIHPQKGQKSLWEAISDLSSKHLIELRDKYYFTIVANQQQAADTEKQQYTYKGQSIDSKLEPSLSGLGDNKLTQRDADEVFGLFAPERYEMPMYRDYNIEKLKDNFRSGKILKARDGVPNIRIGFLFNGAVGHISELDKASAMTEQNYEIALNSCGRSQYTDEQRTYEF